MENWAFHVKRGILPGAVVPCSNDNRCVKNLVEGFQSVDSIRSPQVYVAKRPSL